MPQVPQGLALEGAADVTPWLLLVLLPLATLVLPRWFPEVKRLARVLRNRLPHRHEAEIESGRDLRRRLRQEERDTWMRAFLATAALAAPLPADDAWLLSTVRRDIEKDPGLVLTLGLESWRMDTDGAVRAYRLPPTSPGVRDYQQITRDAMEARALSREMIRKVSERASLLDSPAGIRAWQRTLGVQPVDGDLGPMTRAAIERERRRHPRACACHLCSYCARDRDEYLWL